MKKKILEHLEGKQWKASNRVEDGKTVDNIVTVNMLRDFYHALPSEGCALSAIGCPLGGRCSRLWDVATKILKREGLIRYNPKIKMYE